MDLNFDTIYKDWSYIFKKSIIDLGNADSFDPWTIGVICLKMIENASKADKNIVLPKNPDVKKYLKQIGFDKIIQELAYSPSPSQMESINIESQNNPNTHEILYCLFRDQFNARLESDVRRMFTNFGMNKEDEQRATALVGELGNNVFDHNEGAWPTDVRGAIIIAQNYPVEKKIEVAVVDPGVGFLESLKTARPTLDNYVSAIKLGLEGVSGRIGEKRGNGLRLIQDWTIHRFSGTVRIQSGDGLVEVDQAGLKERGVQKIYGTLAEFVVFYR